MNNDYTPAVPTTAAPIATGPFAGIPASDYLRDSAAVVLLLVSFAMPWNFESVATSRIEVILITLLSVFSLSITYLARTGVFPPSVTVRTVWMLRLVANVPYVALVLTYMIIDAVLGASSTAGGVGSAATFGLAGAILAAQPRTAEVRNQPQGAALGELWLRIFIGFAAVAALASLTGFILVLAQYANSFATASTIILVVAIMLLTLTAVVLLYGGVLRRSESARLVALAIGSAVLGAVLVDLFSRFNMSGNGVTTLHAGGHGPLLLGALAGLAASPGLRLAMTATDPLKRWLHAASMLLIVAAGLSGFTALVTVVTLASGLAGATFVGFAIGTIVTVVAISLVAIVARTVLVSNPAGSRTLVLALVGLMLLLGTVHIVLAVTGPVGVSILDLILAFGLPLITGLYLTIPKEVRDYYLALVTGHERIAKLTYAEQLTAPVQPVDARTVHAAMPVAAPAAGGVLLALDPETPAAVLFQLAKDEPGLHPYIAANPAAYPDLLAWLGSLGDPATDAALRARAQTSS